MFGNKVFQITFIISLFAHGLILLSNPNLNFFAQNKQEQKMEVSYVKQTPKEARQELKTQGTKNEPFLKLSSKISADRRIPPPYVDRQSFFKANKVIDLKQIGLNKPVLVKPDIISVKKKITLPPIDIDKINNPTYVSYYQIVREKIRRAAYQNYTSSETGEVYLSFIVSSEGYLTEMRLSEEKSSTSPYLREIALRSIKEASPFPPFPKELDYPKLSFNVIISFEIE
jgi:TonB family protein